MKKVIHGLLAGNFLVLVLGLSVCAEQPTAAYTVGAGSLEETLALYSALTGDQVDNCIWGILHPFGLDGEATTDKAAAITSLDDQFEKQGIQLHEIAAGRKVAVWKKPKAIKKIHVGDLARFYALLTGKRVELVQSVQFWADLPENGVPKGDAVTWMEGVLKLHGARLFPLGDGRVVIGSQ